MDPTAPAIHEEGNLFQQTKIRKGNVDEGIKESDVIVEGTYRTHLMDHMAMEPEAGLAYVDASGVLNILTSTQYPFRDRRQIAPALNLSMNMVRVIQAPIGGGFGRKDDITVEIHVGRTNQRWTRADRANRFGRSPAAAMRPRDIAVRMRRKRSGVNEGGMHESRNRIEISGGRSG